MLDPCFLRIMKDGREGVQETVVQVHLDRDGKATGEDKRAQIEFAILKTGRRASLSARPLTPKKGASRRDPQGTGRGWPYIMLNSG